jgi:WD40 repeat protein
MRVGEDLRVGTEIAGYRVEALLGRGGMSVVYMAEDLRLRRKVALKLMAPGLAEDESFRERFLRESELAASIDHPNIVPIYEAGESDGLLFIAMRYVQGSDLKELLGEGRLDPSEAIALLAQVASALDAAHARGLVHRDVKPSNVLLDRGARPDGSDHAYLTDFGLTKRISEQTGLGDDGHLMGTIDYVAPEQIAGEDVDARADVYSLGCVLYECVIGQPPFPRDTDVAVVFAHLNSEPTPASATRPELPSGLDAVIATALAKEREERYQSPRDLAQAALSVTVDEATRLLADVATRAAAGRSDLSQLEAELAGKVVDVQVVREQARLIAGSPVPDTVAARGVCPFKGLASFEPADADYFFGRERLIAELVAGIVGTPFLGIVGPSGSGKSSVLRAGFMPAIAAGVLPGSERWRRVLIRPGERPLDELRRMFASGARDPVAEALDTLKDDERLLLAVDQLEELFTACDSEDERANFVDTLARAAADPRRRGIVAVALRADFYGRFAAYPSLADRLGANHVLVGSMHASELRRAIELPAGRVGLRVERELVDALVDDVEGEPGALPLLSTALLELWQGRDGNVLTLAAYRESEGVHGAVARLAEASYGRISDKNKPLAKAILLRLVGEGEGQIAVRRRAPLAELDLERNEAAASVLATLADSRLVTVSEGSVEVAHEALLREWPRLRDWIEDDSQGRTLRRHITAASRAWDEAERDHGELYRGARLAAALDWSADHSLDLNELERAFVSESRAVSEQEAKRARRTNRRLRGLLAGVAILLVAAVAGGISAAIQRGEAQRAETVELAQRLGAQALVEEELDLSLLLARQAVAIEDSPQTRSYLLANLLRTPTAIGIMHGSTDVLTGIAVSPDGRTLAVSEFEGRVRFFDARIFEPRGEPLLTEDKVRSLAYSPDGDTIALGGRGYVHLIDARTHEQVAKAPIGIRSATRLAFTSDGSKLAVVESQDIGPAWITIREAATLRRMGPPIEPQGFAGRFISQWWTDPNFVLTPDGASLVTASADGELAWWNLESRTKTRTLEIPDGYRALALSPDGFTAAIGLDRGLRLVDLRTGKVREATSGLTANPTWLQFSPDGKTVVSTSLDGTVTLWNAGSAMLRETLRGHSAPVQQPAFSPDGRTLYTTSFDRTAIAWDLRGDRGLKRPFVFTHDRRFTTAGFEGHPGSFSPNEELMALGLKEQGIRLWDTSDLTPVGRPFLKTGGEVWALAFAPDGRRLAAVTVEGQITLWDVERRSLLERWFTAERPVLGLSISANGEILATSGPDGVKLWDLSTGEARGTIGDGIAAGDVAFSPAGPLVAFVHEHGGDAEVWEVVRRSRVATMRVGSEYSYYAIAFSPDGRALATGALDDPLVRVWDVRTGSLTGEFDQGTAGALTLDFSLDGRVLAVSGFEPVASLWDVATGTQIGPPLAAGSRRAEIDLSPDGRRLLLTHSDGRGALWDVDPRSWAQRACDIANRRLTLAEWEEFLPGRRYEPACG